MAARPAIREKSRGIWQTFTWAEYQRQVRDFALGLAAHGFRRGDKLAVIGDNRPRLYWAQLAAQCLGGIAVPMYQDAIATEMAFVLSHAEIWVVVAEDQEQVDKILSLKAQLPHLELVVYDDPRGMRHYPTPALEPFERVAGSGPRVRSHRIRAMSTARSTKAPRRMWRCLTYTSGTTGHPKGVMLSHANLLSRGRRALLPLRTSAPTDNILCYLPMAWIGKSLFSLVLDLARRIYLQLPGAPGHGAARPARARPDGRARAAAHLGEHADPAAGAGGGRDTA